MSDRLLAMADYLAAKKPKLPEWRYSEALHERYQFGIGGALRFESGVVYTASELSKLRGADLVTKLSVHEIKKTFKGAQLT